jgi:hypothetical protein
MTSIHSIPHASKLGNNHNGHQIISISPTNSTSGVSGLANDKNTTVPECDQLPGSGEETVDEKDRHDKAKTTETTEDETTKGETTGQGPAR